MHAYFSHWEHILHYSVRPKAASAIDCSGLVGASKFEYQALGHEPLLTCLAGSGGSCLWLGALGDTTGGLREAGICVAENWS